MQGTVLGAGDTVQRSKKDIVWALSWLPGRMREMDEYLATTKLEEESGIRGALGLQKYSGRN